VNAGARCLVILALLIASGCDDMVAQPKQKVYSPLVGPAAIPAGIVEFDERPQGAPALTLALLERGQERYRIYCTPCHSELGDGRGMVVERGFPPPPSYHIDRLRLASPQYLVDVITRGHGVMYSFANRVQPPDRWAIAAYIKALQRSQNASTTDVPADARGALP
jgi:mono/diheme cytochrome c family protein